MGTDAEGRPWEAQGEAAVRAQAASGETGHPHLGLGLPTSSPVRGTRMAAPAMAALAPGPGFGPGLFGSSPELPLGL